MENSFYFESNALNYIIGHFLLFERNIIFVSPWISNIEIKLPHNNRIDKKTMRLDDLIKLLKENISSIIVSKDKFNDFFLKRIPSDLDIKKIEDLHAKAIISDDIIYMGSANITRGGTKKNKELCQLQRNPYSDSKIFLERRMGIKIR